MTKTTEPQLLIFNKLQLQCEMHKIMFSLWHVFIFTKKNNNKTESSLYSPNLLNREVTRQWAVAYNLIRWSGLSVQAGCWQDNKFIDILSKINAPSLSEKFWSDCKEIVLHFSG